jgi:hypothetical protein
MDNKKEQQKKEQRELIIRANKDYEAILEFLKTPEAQPFFESLKQAMEEYGNV